MFEGRDQRKAYFMMPSASERSLTYSLTAVKNDGSALSQTGRAVTAERTTFLTACQNRAGRQYRKKILSFHHSTINDSVLSALLMQGALAGLGFPTGAEVTGKTDVTFDITQFLPLLDIYQGVHRASNEAGTLSPAHASAI